MNIGHVPKPALQKPAQNFALGVGVKGLL